eukprot:Clim_evm10s151 gene=Clim_evmTU10s151
MDPYHHPEVSEDDASPSRSNSSPSHAVAIKVSDHSQQQSPGGGKSLAFSETDLRGTSPTSVVEDHENTPLKRHYSQPLGATLVASTDRSKLKKKKNQSWFGKLFGGARSRKASDRSDMSGESVGAGPDMMAPRRSSADSATLREAFPRTNHDEKIRKQRSHQPQGRLSGEGGGGQGSVEGDSSGLLSAQEMSQIIDTYGSPTGRSGFAGGQGSGGVMYGKIGFLHISIIGARNLLVPGPGGSIMTRREAERSDATMSVGLYCRQLVAHEVASQLSVDDSQRDSKVSLGSSGRGSGVGLQGKGAERLPQRAAGGRVLQSSTNWVTASDRPVWDEKERIMANTQDVVELVVCMHYGDDMDESDDIMPGHLSRGSSPEQGTIDDLRNSRDGRHVPISDSESDSDDDSLDNGLMMPDKKGVPRMPSAVPDDPRAGEVIGRTRFTIGLKCRPGLEVRGWLPLTPQGAVLVVLRFEPFTPSQINDLFSLKEIGPASDISDAEISERKVKLSPARSSPLRAQFSQNNDDGGGGSKTGSYKEDSTLDEQMKKMKKGYDVGVSMSDLAAMTGDHIIRPAAAPMKPVTCDICNHLIWSSMVRCLRCQAMAHRKCVERRPEGLSPCSAGPTPSIFGGKSPSSGTQSKTSRGAKSSKVGSSLRLPKGPLVGPKSQDITINVIKAAEDSDAEHEHSAPVTDDMAKDDMVLHKKSSNRAAKVSQQTMGERTRSMRSFPSSEDIPRIDRDMEEGTFDVIISNINARQLKEMRLSRASGVNLSGESDKPAMVSPLYVVIYWAGQLFRTGPATEIRPGVLGWPQNRFQFVHRERVDRLASQSLVVELHSGDRTEEERGGKDKKETKGWLSGLFGGGGQSSNEHTASKDSLRQSTYSNSAPSDLRSAPTADDLIGFVIFDLASVRKGPMHYDWRLVKNDKFQGRISFDLVMDQNVVVTFRFKDARFHLTSQAAGAGEDPTLTLPSLKSALKGIGGSSTSLNEMAAEAEANAAATKNSITLRSETFYMDPAEDEELSRPSSGHRRNADMKLVHPYYYTLDYNGALPVSKASTVTLSPTWSTTKQMVTISVRSSVRDLISTALRVTLWRLPPRYVSADTPVDQILRWANLDATGIAATGSTNSVNSGDREHGPKGDEVVCKCWVSLSKYLDIGSKFGQVERDLAIERRNINERLFRHGLQCGQLRGRMEVEGLPSVVPMMAGVSSETGVTPHAIILNVDDPTLSDASASNTGANSHMSLTKAQQRALPKELRNLEKDYEELVKRHHRPTAKLATPKATGGAFVKRSDLGSKTQSPFYSHQASTTTPVSNEQVHDILNRILSTLQASAKRSLRTFVYQDHAGLNYARRLYLNLWDLLISYADSAAYTDRRRYFQIITAVTRRSELTNELPAWSSNPEGLLTKPADVMFVQCLRVVLNKTVNYILVKMGKHAGSYDALRDFSTTIFVYAFLYQPWLRKCFCEELLSDQERYKRIIREWVSAEWDINDCRRWMTPQATETHGASMAMFSSIDMKDLIDRAPAKTKKGLGALDHLTSGLNEDEIVSKMHEILHQRLRHRGIFFFGFVQQLMKLVGSSADAKGVDYSWHHLAGYPQVLKAALMEMRRRKVEAYPDALMDTVRSLQRDEDTVNTLMHIVVGRSSVYNLQQVYASLQFLDVVLEGIRQRAMRRNTNNNLIQYVAASAAAKALRQNQNSESEDGRARSDISHSEVQRAAEALQIHQRPTRVGRTRYDSTRSEVYDPLSDIGGTSPGGGGSSNAMLGMGMLAAIEQRRLNDMAGGAVIDGTAALAMAQKESSSMYFSVSDVVIISAYLPEKFDYDFLLRTLTILIDQEHVEIMAMTLRLIYYNLDLMGPSRAPRLVESLFDENRFYRFLMHFDLQVRKAFMHVMFSMIYYELYLQGVLAERRREVLGDDYETVLHTQISTGDDTSLRRMVSVGGGARDAGGTAGRSLSRKSSVASVLSAREPSAAIGIPRSNSARESHASVSGASPVAATLDERSRQRAASQPMSASAPGGGHGFPASMEEGPDARASSSTLGVRSDYGGSLTIQKDPPERATSPDLMLPGIAAFGEMVEEQDFVMDWQMVSREEGVDANIAYFSRVAAIYEERLSFLQTLDIEECRKKTPAELDAMLPFSRYLLPYVRYTQAELPVIRERFVSLNGVLPLPPALIQLKKQRAAKASSGAVVHAAIDEHPDEGDANGTKTTASKDKPAVPVPDVLPAAGQKGIPGERPQLEVLTQVDMVEDVDVEKLGA